MNNFWMKVKELKSAAPINRNAAIEYERMTGISIGEHSGECDWIFPSPNIKRYNNKRDLLNRIKDALKRKIK
jgi:hypothetical protein